MSWILYAGKNGANNMYAEARECVILGEVKGLKRIKLKGRYAHELLAEESDLYKTKREVQDYIDSNYNNGTRDK